MAEEERSPLEPQIEQALRDLASGSAAKRRKAAYFLGEAAHGDAVPTLISVYQTDKNAMVRRAAAYALGQFRAVDTALNKGEEAKVTALLRAVEMRGELGKRAPIRARVRTIIALIVSLVLIGVLFAFRSDLAGTILGAKTDRSALLTDIRQTYSDVGADAQKLRDNYLEAITGHPLSCSPLTTATGSMYALDPRDAKAYEDINTIVAELNAVQRILEQARMPYETACAGNAGEFGEPQANTAMQMLSPVIGALAAIDLKLSVAEANTVVQPTATPIPPTEVPTIEPTTPPEPTAAPTTEAATAPVEATSADTGNADATAAAFNVDAAITQLYAITDEVIGARGASTLLVQYWEDVGNTGSTAGCTAARPSIPDNPVVVPESSDPTLTALRSAAEAINNGLNAVQNGWTDFTFACNSRNLMAVLPSNLANARTAQASFQTAEAYLDQLRGGNVIVTATTPP